MHIPKCHHLKPYHLKIRLKTNSNLYGISVIGVLAVTLGGIQTGYRNFDADLSDFSINHIQTLHINFDKMILYGMEDGGSTKSMEVS